MLDAQALQRDLVVQLAIVRAEHRAHAAFADLREDFVAVREQQAGPQFLARVRRERDLGAGVAGRLIVGERLFELRLRAQFRDHAFERAGQRADFAALRRRQRDVELSAPDLFRAFRELTDWLRDPPRHQQRQRHRGEQHEQAGDQQAAAQAVERREFRGLAARQQHRRDRLAARRHDRK